MNRLVALARLGLVGFAAASLSLSTGCGMDVGVSGSTGTGGHDGGAGGGCSNGGTGTGIGTGGGPSMSTSATSSTGTGGPVFCGGDVGTQCAADEYCDYPSNSCGFADEGGKCKPKPDGLRRNLLPRLRLRRSDLRRRSASPTALDTTWRPAGTCTPPPGMFACGQHFCNAATQFCQKDLSDVSGWPDDYSCPELPAACGGTPSCGCITADPCGQC